MPTSTRRILGEAFLSIQGPLISIIGLALGIASWVVPIPTATTIPLLSVARWSLVAGILFVLGFATLLRAFVATRSMSQLPRVRHGRRTSRAKDTSSAIALLLDSSDLFGHGLLVSVYYMDDSEFEELLGVGYVLNIQENGMIQVVFEPRGDAARSTAVDRVAGNDAAALKRLRVKPSAPHGYTS